MAMNNHLQQSMDQLGMVTNPACGQLDKEGDVFPAPVSWYHSIIISFCLNCITSRALSLRNLVSGYECGRVFPAGVGPGSPSRDAANWLLSRFGLSVETRRQYGWLRMVFSGARLFRAPTWWPSGGWRHARGREHCRGEPGSSLPGGYAPDSAKAEGSSIVDEPGKG